MAGYVERPSYINQMMRYLDNRGLVKILTGIYGCGKSVLLEQFRQHLLRSGFSEKDVVIIDLKTMRHAITSERVLYDYISSKIETKEPVILIDDVHLIKGWERVVDSIRLKYDANIYVTSSKTMSETLMTHLTGRFVEIHVYPFSFKEFLSRYPIDSENGHTQRLVQYLRYGGMPIIDLNDDDRKNRAILRGMYDSAVNLEIRPDMDVDQTILDSISSFVMSNIGNQFSYNGIASGSYTGDQRTVERYLGKLCDCFIFYKANRYDVIGGRHLKTNAKFYLADTGFKDAILMGSEYNEGALLENAVFMELLRRGYKVSVGSYKDKEIDFTAWSDDGVEFYQVVHDVKDPRVLNRELRSMTKLDGKRFLITMDKDVSEVPEGIEVIDAVEFFLK